MKRILFVCALLLASQQVVRSAIWIACQGTQSTGGGNLNYEYMLQNVGGAIENISVFSIATDDLNIANYTSITQPQGWIFQGISQPGYWVSTVKTAHGFVSPGPAVVSAGALTWSLSGGTQLNPGATLGTFGFNNPNMSQDGEWNVVGTPGGFTTWSVPVAGPMGIYTDGPVHVPVPEPAATMMVVAGSLLLIPVYRRWKAAR